MIRAIRLVVDTEMHGLWWSREKAVQFFLEHGTSSPLEVETEIDRYLVMPEQALGYKMGQLRIQELRSRWEKRLGPSFNIRRFHDQVLAEGALPLEVFEQLVDRWGEAEVARVKKDSLRRPTQAGPSTAEGLPDT